MTSIYIRNHSVHLECSIARSASDTKITVPTTDKNVIRGSNDQYQLGSRSSSEMGPTGTMYV